MRRRDSVALLLVAAVGCAGPWRLSSSYEPRAPRAFSAQELVGQGVIRTADGLLTRACLDSFETTTPRQWARVELYRAEDPRLRQDPRLQSFLEASRARAAALAGRGPEPVCLVLSVHAPEQWTELVETSAKFRSSLDQMLREGNREDFEKRCGRDVVTAAAYESAGYVFLAWLPTTEDDAARMRRMLAQRLAEQPDDMLQLSLLDDLPPAATRVFAMRADAREPLTPTAFPLQRQKGKGVMERVSQLMQAVDGSGRGRLVKLQTRPWRTLGQGRLLGAGPAQGPRPPVQLDFVDARLEILEQDVERYRLWTRQASYLVPRHGPVEARVCLATLAPGQAALAPERVSACVAQARETRTGALERVPACAGVIAALQRLRGAAACRVAAAAADAREAAVVQDSAFLPIELSLEVDGRWAQKGDPFEAPYADTWEAHRPKERIALGTGMFRTGEKAPARCVEEEDGSAQPTLPGDLALPGRDEGEPHWDPSVWDELEAKPSPDAGREPARMDGGFPPNGLPDAGLDLALPDAGFPPLALAPSGEDGEGGAASTGPGGDEAAAEPPGGEQPGNAPAPEDGAAPMTGEPAAKPGDSSKKDPRVFRVTDEVAFYARRGWPWWKRLLLFWKKPPADRPIERGVFELAGVSKKLSPDFKLTPEARELAGKDLETFYRQCGTHYVAQLEHRRGFVFYLSQGAPGDREITLLPFGLTATGAASPFLKPATVADFFQSREQTVALFEDDAEAIPVRLGLEPWISYLRAHGLVNR